MNAMTEATVSESIKTLKSLKPITVSTGKKEFQIHAKTTAGLFGYAVFEDGKRKSPYRILKNSELFAWLSELELISK